MFIGVASVVAMLVFSGCNLFKKKSEEEVIKEKQIELFKTTNINATVKNVKKENGKMMITVEIAGKEYQYEMEPYDNGYMLSMKDQWDIRSKIKESGK